MKYLNLKLPEIETILIVMLECGIIFFISWLLQKFGLCSFAQTAIILLAVRLAIYVDKLVMIYKLADAMQDVMKEHKLPEDKGENDGK